MFAYSAFKKKYHRRHKVDCEQISGNVLFDIFGTTCMTRGPIGTRESRSWIFRARKDARLFSRQMHGISYKTTWGTAPNLYGTGLKEEALSHKALQGFP